MGEKCGYRNIQAYVDAPAYTKIYLRYAGAYPWLCYPTLVMVGYVFRYICYLHHGAWKKEKNKEDWM